MVSSYGANRAWGLLLWMKCCLGRERFSLVTEEQGSQLILWFDLCIYMLSKWWPQPSTLLFSLWEKFLIPFIFSCCSSCSTQEWKIFKWPLHVKLLRKMLWWWLSSMPSSTTLPEGAALLMSRSACKVEEPGQTILPAAAPLFPTILPTSASPPSLLLPLSLLHVLSVFLLFIFFPSPFPFFLLS